MRARIVTVAMAVVLVYALAAPLLAHMKLAKSEPASNAKLTRAPKQVQVWFTQAPDPKVSKLEMEGPGGPVKLTGFRVMEDKSMIAMVEGTLSDGRYTVRWRAAGDDGHIQKGEFAFTVLQTN